MNVMLFLDKCREVLPPSKDLSPSQWAAYREKLSPFSEDQLGKLYDAVLENCKFFPKIADVYECAKDLGFTEKKTEYRPHTWTPTDCQLCGGSGLVAAFWSQEFEITGEDKTQILRLHYLYPYHQSGAYARQKDHDDIRTAHRCQCEAGAAPTLARGVPRWTQDTPQVRRRDWA
jgi:hypothetical protein